MWQLLQAEFTRALEDAFAYFSQVEGKQKDPLISETGKIVILMIIFYWNYSALKRMQEEETNCFHTNHYFVFVKRCLLFFKKPKKQIHISKEAEMKLPYLTVIMTHTKEVQCRVLLFYTVPLQYWQRERRAFSNTCLSKFSGDISPPWLEQTTTKKMKIFTVKY